MKFKEGMRVHHKDSLIYATLLEKFRNGVEAWYVLEEDSGKKRSWWEKNLVPPVMNNENAVTFLKKGTGF